MEQRINIILHEEVPPAIVDIAHKAFNPIPTVDAVYFTRNCGDLMEGRMAAFVPSMRSVVIDLDACVKDLRWMEIGTTFIANAWFNLLYCVFHEAAHARQVETDIDDYLSEDELEHQAHKNALEDMLDWSMANKMPENLDSMGYLGMALQRTLNSIYDKHPNKVDMEIAAYGKGVAAVSVIMERHPNLQKTKTSLKTATEEGCIGVMINGVPHLTMYEFLDLDGDTWRGTCPDEQIHVALTDLFATKYLNDFITERRLHHDKRRKDEVGSKPVQSDLPLQVNRAGA